MTLAIAPRYESKSVLFMISGGDERTAVHTDWGDLHVSGSCLERWQCPHGTVFAVRCVYGADSFGVWVGVAGIERERERERETVKGGRVS